MKSSTGEHYIALDHVRALAVLLVFTYHFIHGGFLNYPVPIDYRPAFFPMSIFNQGHTGVSLFMALSGYLFAKLLDGRQVNYLAFYWNRALRLFPLLILVMIICGIQTWLYKPRSDFRIYIYLIEHGWYKPVINGVPAWPNGAWSIAAELHFYALLPLILFLQRKSRLALPALLLAALAFRTWLQISRGEVHMYAYFTLIGRIDQFLFGILAYQYRRHFAHRHLLFWTVFTAFLLFYAYFNLKAGFARDNPSLTSPGATWIYLPTMEGLVYGMLIAYYDNTFKPVNAGVSKWIGYVGAYSYSIYLLHFFVVYQLMGLVDGHVMKLSNFYLACAWALVCFLPMMPMGYLSFRFIEAPFLAFRRRYLRAPAPQPQPA